MVITDVQSRCIPVVYADSESAVDVPLPTAQEPKLKSPTSSSNDGKMVIEADPKEISAHVKHVTPLLKASRHSNPLITGSISKEAAISAHTAHTAFVHGLSKEKEDRIRELYDRLDMNGDGLVDIRDLTTALKREVPHIPSKLAPKLMARISADNDTVNFGEFVKYVVEHEKRLELIFQDLDQDRDGYIDVREIKSYCNDLGIPIDDQRARNIVEKILYTTEDEDVARERMDQTGSASIDLSEFQEFMLLYPSSDVKDIVDFWRHNLVIDIGEDSQVPEDFTPQEIQSGAWWRHLVAGAVAGCMSRTSTAPFDRLKVYMQVHATKQNRLGILSCVRLLHAEGGAKSFWRGNGLNVIKIAPESALKFMAYEQCKRLIQKFKGDSELTVVERFCAGSSAGAISQTVIYPMEVMKTRLALRKTGQLDHGLIHFAQKMYYKEGLLCFYKGYVPNLLGIIPYAGIDLAIYETLKKKYISQHPGGEPGIIALLSCAAVSSTCGQLASYPLALVRTRLQARALSLDAGQPDTMVGQFRWILQNEGPLGLYRGMGPNFMKVIPAVGISYVVYEKVRGRLGATMS